MGAFPPRPDVGYLGNRQAYDFGREIWGGRDRLQKFDGSWPLCRSTAFHEAREDVERGNVDVGDGVGTAHVVYSAVWLWLVRSTCGGRCGGRRRS